MKLRSFAPIATATGFAILLAAGVALAASPLKTGTAYSYYNRGQMYGITLITSASNPSRLIAGPSTPPIGSQDAVATGSIACPGAKRSPTLPKADKPFVLFSFPGATLKLSHGRYSFRVSRTVRHQFVEGSSAPAFTARYAVTGTVRSARLITGALSVTGGPCPTRRALPFRAKLTGAPVAPGQ